MKDHPPWLIRFITGAGSTILAIILLYEISLGRYDNLLALGFAELCLIIMCILGGRNESHQ